MRLRLFAGIAGLTLTAGLLTACSSDSSPSGGGTDVIKVAVSDLPTAKGDPFRGIGSPEVYTLTAMFDALTLVTQTGEIMPALAKSWTQTEASIWEFELRDDVTFSNGAKFDADSVVAAFDYLLKDPEGSASVVAADVKTIASVTAVSPSKVRFTTTAPDAQVPARVGEVYIPEPKTFKDKGATGFAADPVGTGPYQVESWAANVVTFKAFNDSWRAPNVANLEISALPDPASRYQALQSGQVDLAVQLSPDQAKELEADNKPVDTIATAQVMALAYITELGDSPLQDKAVREALNYAVDKEAMAKDLLLGIGKPNGSGITDAAAGHNPDVEPFPYDPEKAKQLLAGAGYPKGFSFDASVTVGSFPADSQIYQLMQQNLADVGVKVNLKQITFAEWLEDYLNNTWKSQAFGLSWNTLPRLDALRPLELYSCLKQPAFFCNDAVADLLKKASAEGDIEKRSAMLREAQSLNREDPPALYLVQQVDITGMSARLEGFENINRTFLYDQMSVS